MKVMRDKFTSIKFFDKIDNDKFRIKCINCGKRFVSSTLQQEYCDYCKKKYGKKKKIWLEI